MSDKVVERIINVTGKEEALLQLIRNLSYGEIIIHVSDGQPIRVEEVKKSIKL